MIGIFDSGVGGLSALLPLRRLLPRADLLYYADTAALPLGERTEDEIRERITAALTFFAQNGANGALLACGTASSLLSQECKEKFAFPIVDIIEPTVHAARALKKDARILLLATEAAVRSGCFALSLASTGHTVYARPAPRLVMLAEGLAKKGEGVAAALSPAARLMPDAVVLGCTHFSLLKEEIGAHLPAARIIDPALCAAASAAARFADEGMGTLRFYTTGDPRRFSARAASILSLPVEARSIP